MGLYDICLSNFFGLFSFWGNAGENSLDASIWFLEKEMIKILKSFIIFSRKSNPFLNLFFFIVKILFGNDVRKTGMYAFFGPYQPIRVSHTLTLLRRAGFTSIDWTGYFPVPPFYEQVYQMFLQYRKSEGSSYLHRETRLTVVSRLLSALFSFQGFMRVGRAGSVVVIRCQK